MSFEMHELSPLPRVDDCNNIFMTAQRPTVLKKALTVISELNIKTKLSAGLFLIKDDLKHAIY